MFKRSYSYKIESRRKFMSGVVHTKSWFPRPEDAINQIMSQAKSYFGSSDDFEIVSFNRV